ncbi:hypothetical protein WJX79_007887 [Trebouxia sp. C0005]
MPVLPKAWYAFALCRKQAWTFPLVTALNTRQFGARTGMERPKRRRARSPNSIGALRWKQQSFEHNKCITKLNDALALAEQIELKHRMTWWRPDSADYQQGALQRARPVNCKKQTRQARIRLKQAVVQLQEWHAEPRNIATTAYDATTLIVKTMEQHSRQIRLVTLRIARWQC